MVLKKQKSKKMREGYFEIKHNFDTEFKAKRKNTFTLNEVYNFMNFILIILKTEYKTEKIW